METRADLSFAELPQDYATLCQVFLPRPIRDETEYENTLEVAKVFAGSESK